MLAAAVGCIMPLTVGDMGVVPTKEGAGAHPLVTPLLVGSRAVPCHVTRLAKPGHMAQDCPEPRQERGH